jgi:hypothetical protein
MKNIKRSLRLKAFEKIAITQEQIGNNIVAHCYHCYQDPSGYKEYQGDVFFKTCEDMKTAGWNWEGIGGCQGPGKITVAYCPNCAHDHEVRNKYNPKRKARLKAFEKIAIDAGKINTGQVVDDGNYKMLKCITALERHDWKFSPDSGGQGNDYTCDKCGADWSSMVG